MTFGQKLKQLRADEGITQKELAEAINETQRLISYYETDRNTAPNLELVEKVSKFFGVSEVSLLGIDTKEEDIAQEFEILGALTQKTLNGGIVWKKNSGNILFNVCFVGKLSNSNTQYELNLNTDPESGEYLGFELKAKPEKREEVQILLNLGDEPDDPYWLPILDLLTAIEEPGRIERKRKLDSLLDELQDDLPF